MKKGKRILIPVYLLIIAIAIAVFCTRKIKVSETETVQSPVITASEPIESPVISATEENSIGESVTEIPEVVSEETSQTEQNGTVTEIPEVPATEQSSAEDDYLGEYVLPLD